MMRPFQTTGITANVVVTGAAAALALVIPAFGCEVRLANIGTVTVFVRLDGVTATVAAGMPIPAGGVEIFEIGPGGGISTIAAGVGSTLYATMGAGQ